MTLHLVEPEVGKICLPQLELMALYECLILGNINFSTNKQLLNKVNEQHIVHLDYTDKSQLIYIYIQYIYIVFIIYIYIYTV